MTVDDKQYINQFIPKKYEYLLENKKIEFKGQQLKTAYLINIIHEMMMKYYLELRSVKRKDFIERMYFDSYEELLNYLTRKGNDIFNWGFDRKSIISSPNPFFNRSAKAFLPCSRFCSDIFTSL